MTRGIQLKELSPADLGPLGLPVDLLGNGNGKGFDVELLDAALSELAAMETVISDGPPEPEAVIQEVRACLEETLVLLTEALPAER